MDTGNCPTEGLKSELNKLRLVLCNAESTLTKAEEKIDRVDVLEAQVVALNSQLKDQNKQGALGLQESTNVPDAWGSEDEQDHSLNPCHEMPRTSAGVTDRVSGFTDGKKQISRCQQGIDAPDARALYEKVQMLQNQNDELRQRIVALEAENKRQTNTVSRLTELNSETILRLTNCTEVQSSTCATALIDAKKGNSINKYQNESEIKKTETNSLTDENNTKKTIDGIVSEHALTATPRENGNESPLNYSANAKQCGELERMYHEETNARLKAIERALRTSEGNSHGRDWVSLKKQQYLPHLNKELPKVKLVYGQPKRRIAQAVLVMRGDSYALGASVLASRVKSLGTHADVVCMVTSDVSESVCECMSQVFDAIYEVPYLQFSCEKLTTKKQQTYYESWIAQSFTKWNALGLLAYEKVLLVDADLLPLCSLDSLFELRVPAATFSSPWANSCKEDGYVDPYVGLEHGSEVPGSMIQQAVTESLAHAEGGKGSYVALGSLVLVEPSQDTYFALMGFISSRQPFGVPGLHSGFDEQSLVLFFNTHYPHRPWTHISQVWNSLAWHERWLGGAEPKAYHYFNTKPWSMSPAKYPDLKIWYSGASDCLKTYPGVEPLFKRCLGNPKYMAEYEEMVATGDRSARAESRWESSRQSDTGGNSPHWGSTSPSMLESRPSWADIQDEAVENARASSSWTDNRQNSQDPPPRSRYSSPAWDDSSSVKNYAHETSQTTPHHARSGHSSSRWATGRNPDRWTRQHESPSSRQGPSMGTPKSGFYGNHWQKTNESNRRAPTPDNWRSPGTIPRESGMDYRSKRFPHTNQSERW